jgi:hypothetical protein
MNGQRNMAMKYLKGTDTETRTSRRTDGPLNAHELADWAIRENLPTINAFAKRDHQRRLDVRWALFLLQKIPVSLRDAGVFAINETTRVSGIIMRLRVLLPFLAIVDERDKSISLKFTTIMSVG